MTRSMQQEVRALIHMASRSRPLRVSVVVTSAMPMPMPLPPEAAVTRRAAMVLMKGCP